MKKIIFLSGTRADYGKLKTLMECVDRSGEFELLIFATGMHMLSKYGETWRELEKDGFRNVYRFINQKQDSHMDTALSNTITGLSNYVHEARPDLIVVHGDRLEALAGAIVGAFNNIKVAHIEGGEVSGTIDESIRHAVSKLSHFHFVANDEAKRRVVQLGEPPENVFIVGSPDIDIMCSDQLPSISQVTEYYGIPFDEYAILMYHPVTTEADRLMERIGQVVDAVLKSGKNYIVIYPNNDAGSAVILCEYKRFEGNPRIKVFPSVRFEYFLTLLKHCTFILGNSSAGIREAGVYRRISIDLGTRQAGRYTPGSGGNIIHTEERADEILAAIQCCEKKSKTTVFEKSRFGDGRSADKFMAVLKNPDFWTLRVQKQFVDVDF